MFQINVYSYLQDQRFSQIALLHCAEHAGSGQHGQTIQVAHIHVHVQVVQQAVPFQVVVQLLHCIHFYIQAHVAHQVLLAPARPDQPVQQVLLAPAHPGRHLHRRLEQTQFQNRSQHLLAHHTPVLTVDETLHGRAHQEQVVPRQNVVVQAVPLQEQVLLQLTYHGVRVQPLPG